MENIINLIGKDPFIMKPWVWIILAVIVILLAGFLALCRKIGGNFLRNLKKKKPGEKFNADIDVSFYMNGPLPKIAEAGMAYMETLPHEDVYITSEDGLKLHATLFPAPDNEKNFVIGIHGFQSHAWNEFAPHIKFYRSIGFGMLLPDDRAHGYSEGEYITMGVKDRRDCICWARYLADRFGADTRLLLHGVSMGGATVLSASGEEDLPEQVLGVVSDCGFTSAGESFACQIESLYHIPPAFPVRVCQWYAAHKAGFDFSEARPIDQVRHAKVPILFIQGKDDVMVPEFMARRLYEACSSDKKLLIVEHANHAESIALDPEGYHRAIRGLFHI
ncbi:MAG: prolyl oligopeptidase family serine peptidase [Candidatus Limivicinus sp.]|jgi:fermentation-respiration switch protein FrsA (DUF1100 family)